ncbi:MAG: PRC-barrel domain-containing protein [Ignavibacteriales bacterium]
MKKSLDIIGLPIFTIADGKEIGQIKDLIVNPDQGSIEFLLVHDASWYVGAKILPFSAIIGIGKYGVTTESESRLLSINESSPALALIQNGVKIKGTRILTRTGDLVGLINEFEVDEETGKVARLEYEGTDGTPSIIEAEQVVTFGKDVLVVEQEIEHSVTVEPIKLVGESGLISMEDSVKETDASRLFVKRQKQLLLGKVIARDVKDDSGGVILAEGTVVNNETLKVAESNGKLVELSQNTR